MLCNQGVTHDRFRTVLAAAAVLVVALLAFFAWSLADSQSQQRQDLEKRFRDRADVSASVTQALFAVSATSTQTLAATRLGGRRIDPAVLERQTRQSQQVYNRILDAKGRVIAATRNAPDPPPDQRHLQQGLRGKPTLSDLYTFPGLKAQVIEWAVPYRASTGARVQVSGLRESLIADFLMSFLGRVPNVADAQSLVVDRRGNVVGSRDRSVRVGRRLAQGGLLKALREEGEEGSYEEDGEGRYFTSAPIAGSSWRVVLSAEREKLYESVSGAKRAVPWAIFGAFALAALLGLWLLRRVAVTTTELQRREVSRRNAVEINDNIIQRLVLAKYELERGSAERSQAKLVETLEEAQRLVSDLLGELPLEPGRLRREGPASTGRDVT